MSQTLEIPKLTIWTSAKPAVRSKRSNINLLKNRMCTPLKRSFFGSSGSSGTWARKNAILAFLRAQVPLEPEDPKNDRFKGVHIRFFSKLMFERLLRTAGFADVQIVSFGISSVCDIFQAMGPVATITSFARRRI